jgi:hypothetical protein
LILFLPKAFINFAINNPHAVCLPLVIWWRNRVWWIDWATPHKMP